MTDLLAIFPVVTFLENVPSTFAFLRVLKIVGRGKVLSRVCFTLLPHVSLSAPQFRVMRILRIYRVFANNDEDDSGQVTRQIYILIFTMVSFAFVGAGTVHSWEQLQPGSFRQSEFLLRGAMVEAQRGATLAPCSSRRRRARSYHLDLSTVYHHSHLILPSQRQQGATKTATLTAAATIADTRPNIRTSTGQRNKRSGTGLRIASSTSSTRSTLSSPRSQPLALATYTPRRRALAWLS